MLVWTGWGIAIPFICSLGVFIGNYLALAIGAQLGTNAPWLMATGYGVGAISAAFLLHLFDEWRETRGGSPRTRVLVQESTGERFDVPVPGDTFFWIHTRRWIIIALVAGVVGAAITIYQQIPLHEL
jgi:hypothetical protein